MKKIKYLLIMALAALSFNACEDVPAPYTLPTGAGSGSGDSGSESYPNVYIDESFAESLGSFISKSIVGSFSWRTASNDYGQAYAIMSGYSNGASQDAETWLISPEIDFSQETAASISFDYVINKGEASAAASNHKMLISSNYTGDVKTADWTEIDYNAINRNSWSFNSTGNLAIPTEMLGQGSVVIAFKYISSTETSSSWEIMNLLVTGENGGNVKVETVPDTPSSIADVIAAGTGKARIVGTVVATYTKGFLAQDETGHILVYLGATPSCKVGDVVNVGGSIGTYGGMFQFGQGSTVAKTGTAEVTRPTPLAITPEALDAYYDTPYIEYVEYTGVLTISGNYYNIAVEGATVKGSVSNPVSGLIDSELNGKEVTVTGYLIGTSSNADGKYINTMATSVTLPVKPLITYTASEYKAAFDANNSDEVILSGYIVGSNTGRGSNFNGKIGAEGASPLNILISDNADENDCTNCVYVSLSNTEIKAALNLQSNPGNFKKKVTLTGKMVQTSFEGIVGLGEITAYTIE